MTGGRRRSLEAVFPRAPASSKRALRRGEHSYLPHARALPVFTRRESCSRLGVLSCAGATCPDPPLHDLQCFCARQMGSIGGEGWGKGSATRRRSEAPLASGEDPRTSFQQHASPVPSVAALGLGLLRLLLPWLGPPVCKIVINRISVLCVLVVALLSRPY